uniref:Major vault protein n=1 Tax=Nothoprocta perdicaria TaxID=30464 RepID=A0A8C6YJN3_NOTPE
RGPQCYVRQDHERVVLGPVAMVTVPARHYCLVRHPVARGADGSVERDGSGQARLRHGDLEVRLAQEPFPLHPGELLEQDVTPLRVVPADTALRLRALLDFEDEDGARRVAGDEWLFEGPGTYIPRKEVEVAETLQATVIRPNQAVRLRARKECTDRDGTRRVTGEEWLVRRVGAYLPGVYEEVLDVVDAFVLTEKVALHLRATRPFRDAQGTLRRTGEEWLVTQAQSDAYVPDVCEELVAPVAVTTLGPRHFCVVLDPVGDDGRPQLGCQKVIKGECSFFLRPGERLQAGIQDVFVLGEDEGLLLQALQNVTHEDEVTRRAGERWLLRGPLEYVPPAEVAVIERRRAVALGDGEGIYVRDMRTGKVRAVLAQTYMLTATEELWEKELAPGVEALLARPRDPRGHWWAGPRGRGLGHGGGAIGVEAGPSQAPPPQALGGPRGARGGGVSISGACPEAGPARRHFEVPEDPAELGRLFSVPDFVGDACKALASRVRGAVAAVSFDDFHKVPPRHPRHPRHPGSPGCHPASPRHSLSVLNVSKVSLVPHVPIVPIV